MNLLAVNAGRKDHCGHSASENITMDEYLFMATKKGTCQEDTDSGICKCQKDRTWQQLLCREDDELIEVKVYGHDTRIFCLVTKYGHVYPFQ